MLREVTSEHGRSRKVAATSAHGRSAWWVRLVSRLPLGLLYAIADLLGWLAFRAFPYRAHVVRANLTMAFPDFDETQLRRVMQRYYRGFAPMLVDVVKSATLRPE